MQIKFEIAELEHWINQQLERTDECANERFKDALRRSLAYVCDSRKEKHSVSDFKNWINTHLESADESLHDQHKEGFSMALEHVLFKTGRYKGYSDNYWIKTGFAKWMADGRPDVADISLYTYGPTGQQYNRHYY
jgi:hypothetical protein